MWNPISILKAATGSEGVVEAMFKTAAGAASVTSAVASVRTDMRTKKMDGKIDTIISDTTAIKDKLGVISAETSDIKNGQMAAVNQFFNTGKKAEKADKKKKKDKKKEKKNDKPAENVAVEDKAETK